MEMRKTYARMMALVLAFALVLTGIGMPKVHAEEPAKPEEDGFTLVLEVKDDKVKVTATVTGELDAGVKTMNLKEGDRSFSLTRKEGEKILSGEFDLGKFRGLFSGTEDQKVTLESGDVKLNGKVKQADAKTVNDAVKEADKNSAKKIYDDLQKTIEADKKDAKYKDAKAKYTKTSWEAFTVAQTVSKEAETDLAKAQAAAKAYKDAKDGLVNIEKLSKAIDDFKKAKKYKDKYYTEDSLKAYKALADKMDDYKKLLENGTKEEVKAATEALNGLKLVLMDVEFIDFISRVSGEDRIATSVEISKKYYEKGKVDAVVVARYDEFPDALAASSLAKAYNGPILLTKSNQLDEEVFKEIKRLAPERVFVVGGDKAVSNGVVAQLRKASVFGVDRIAGETRYETSAAVARQVVKKQGYTMKAVIATGENWPDALTASTLAVAKNSPVLLVRSDRVDSAVKEAIKDLKITGVYIIGGTGAISKSVEKALPTVIERLEGEDRYGTAKAVAEYAFPESDHAFLASGESFADAMTIGPVAGSQESPILLSTVKLHKTAEKVLKNGTIDHFTIIGGTVRIATMDLEAEENIRDARSKAGLSITKRYNGKVPTLKEALEGAENRSK